ncbi:MAG: hypothetical protein DRI57_27965 [Deltaproteobacteria bacterium]|nr:MAG: hypothetical protein DRI57_27965 [Deltaproteobacteria bacterium]
MGELLFENRVEMYPYAYIYQKRKTILVWQTNGEDTFRLDSENCLISAQTVEGLKHILGKDADSVEWSEGAEINFDRFRTALKNMRRDRASSEKTCSLLLDGWNFLEDMARTFGLDKETEKLRIPTLNKAYDKLLYGNNLPPMTPEGCSYHPLWTSEEISALRRSFRNVFNLLMKKGVFKESLIPIYDIRLQGKLDRVESHISM